MKGILSDHLSFLFNKKKIVCICMMQILEILVYNIGFGIVLFVEKCRMKQKCNEMDKMGNCQYENF